MSRIVFDCPHCGTRLQADSANAGASMRCFNCEGLLTVPTANKNHSEERSTPRFTDARSRVQGAFGSAISELRALNYSELIPTREILSMSNLRNPTVQWILLLGVMPLVMSVINSVAMLSPAQSVLMIMGYFGVLWAMFFYRMLRPSRSIWRSAVLVAIFTAVIGLPLLFLAQRMPIVSDLYAGTRSSAFVGRLIGYVLGVGLFEELCKSLPLLLGTRNGRTMTEREGLYLGLISGLGFAAMEGVTYVIMTLQMFPGAAPWQFMFRILSGPLLHGAMAGVVGYFIARGTQQSGKRWPYVVVGIGFMGLLHGLYDVFAATPLSIVLAAIIMISFLTYVRRLPVEVDPTVVEEIKIT